MPKDRINAICLEFEDPTDLAQFLSSNLIDDDIDSDHSVVDQPGPGRTVDKLITKAGRKLEGLVNASGKMVDSSRTTSVSISHPLQSLDAFQTFAAAHSVEMLSGSDETASNLMGPGRTLGNFLSNAGRRLQVALGSTAERLGKGPSAAMDRIVSLTDELERARNNKLYPAGSSELLRSGMVVKLDLERGPRSFISPPRASDVLVSHLIRYFSHDLSEDLTKNTKFVDSCRRLVAYLRHPKPNTQYLGLYYMSAIITAYPSSRALFLSLGAKVVLDDLVNFCHFLPRSNSDRNLLLAPSRRALIFLSESEVLSAIKEFDAVPKERTRDTQKLALALMQHSTQSSGGVLAARQLADALLRFRSAMPLVPRHIVESWAQMAIDPEPVSSSTFSTVLQSLKMIYMTRLDDEKHQVFWSSFVLPIVQVFFQTWTDAENFNVQILAELLGLFPPDFGTSNWYANRLTHQTRNELRQLVNEQSCLTDPTIERSGIWASLGIVASPFHELWGAFCREWDFNFCERVRVEQFPTRIIAYRKRRALCRALVGLVSRSECSLEHVVQVADRDQDCREEILRLLNLQNLEDNAVLSELISTLSRPRPYQSKFLRGDYRYQEEYCTRIARCRCGPNSFWPEFEGSIKAYGIQSRPYIQFPDDGLGQSTEDHEDILLAEVAALRWAPASELPKLPTRYRPIIVFDNNGEQEYIGGMLARGGEGMRVFSVPYTWEMPEAVGGCVNGQLHVLVGSQGDEPSTDIFWYNRSASCLVHAITSDRAPVPPWLLTTDHQLTRRTSNFVP